jgi:PTS system nitrogen regulatory IIA component
MDLSDLLDRESVGLRGAVSKRQALTAIAEIAARRFGVDAGAALEALLERERTSSTGVGSGVAAPHARLSGLERIRGVFVRLEQPVPFHAVDDQPVDLLFALFAPPSADTEHLRALARVSRMLRQPELREQLRQARSPDAMYALLAREPRSSAA